MSKKRSHSSRPFPIPQEWIDTSNSVSWFLMDAFWMVQVPFVSRMLILPTLLTGLVLLYVEKRKPVIFINLAINCWILMNVFWMLSDSYPSLLPIARVLFGLGVCSILGAVRYSSDLRETFSHFRRFRLMSFGQRRPRVVRRAQSTPRARAIQ